MITTKGVKAVRPVSAPSRQLATVQQVKKMLHQNVETKLVGLQYNASFNNRINTPGDIIQILPNTTNGTGNNDRIGNKITPRGLKVVVSMTVNDVTPGPGFELLPRLFILSSRQQKDWQYVPATVDLTKLLDDGTGERPFLGDIHDYQAPVNRESFIVHKDVKTKICLGTDEQNLGRVKTYTFWIKCPKVLNYDDLAATPNNFAPFLSMGFACGDFSQPSDAYTAVKLAMTSTLYFEDA